MSENNECVFAASEALNSSELDTEEWRAYFPLSVRLVVESLMRSQVELEGLGLDEEEIVEHEDLEFEMNRRVCFRSGCNLNLRAFLSPIFNSGLIRDPAITLASDCINRGSLAPPSDSFTFIASQQPENPFPWLIASADNSCDTEDK